MKTKNNVQKAVLKTLAGITSLVLLSFTVGAQDSFKELLASNSLGAIAEVLVENKAENTGSPDRFSFIVEADEPTLEMEDWMVDGNFFNATVFNVEAAAEAPLEVESWMIDDAFFNSPATEKSLELESWMVYDKFWD